MDSKAKDLLEPVVAEFRAGITHHRAEGATEERIKQILVSSVRALLFSRLTILSFALGSARSSARPQD